MNPGPLVPKTSALAKLSYVPFEMFMSYTPAWLILTMGDGEVKRKGLEQTLSAFTGDRSLGGFNDIFGGEPVFLK